MAPVTGTPIGVTAQIIDDPKLIRLQNILNSFEINTSWKQSSPSSPSSIHTTATTGPAHPPLDIDSLVAQLNKFQTWRFEEQADLCEWIHPLNVIDAALSYLMKKHPSVLLIAPLGRKQDQESTRPSSESVSPSSCEFAESLQAVSSVPASVYSSLCTLLRFLSNLLQNSINKSSFNSSDELVDLLAAADDQVAATALEALCNLATPPSLHKQQAPEVHQHVTALHNSKSNAHKRLLALARGWGSRGSGLGLFSCVTADDSEQGQGTLPMEAGELTFEFFASSSSSSSSDSETNNVTANVESERVEQNDSDRSRLVRIHLSTQDIVDSPLHTVESSKQKRRRTETITGRTGRGGMETKSTAELFFRCLEQVGGRQSIPEDRLFALLADIRLAKGFHSHNSRVRAVESRLRALITILHAHPSQDVMTGYFHAQPELCIELIDLLRPTVSSASVSSSTVKQQQRNDGNTSSNLAGDIAAMATLANSPSVPYSVRTLSLEALTGLVARRDGAGSGGSRQSNVLNELGVAKGQYLGPLPTLIRYSLASLSSFLASAAREVSLKSTEKSVPQIKDETSIALDVGLAFVEATKPPALSQRIQLERALEFIDSVLTLTSAVVSAPSGTAALTDCGLIPALLSTVSVDSSFAFYHGEISSDHDDFRSNSLMRFITAQSIQIIEGAIVTHNNALSAFHELKGVHVLIKRLNDEIVEIKHNRKSSKVGGSPTDDAMDCEPATNESSRNRQLCSSRRVLLFSIVNCLTVVFHQESTSSSSLTPSGGSQLRKPELSDALMEIMENVDSYGGVLVALTASLLSDVMNSDPHVVHHVHKSGLGNSFLKMLMGNNSEREMAQSIVSPILPAVPELIMAIPNVIAALSLTEDGSKEILKANPFPALLAVFYHPKYSMPNSSCLLNELTAIVGTGLDEIMRHVPILRPQVMKALVNAMRRVVEIGQELVAKEETRAEGLENDRTCLMQYALNFGQMLEQILHNEDHSDPFVEAGGLETILDLFPLLLPSHTSFLTHISCLSCTSVCTLSHSTTEDSLTVAFKSIALHCDTEKMLEKMIHSLDRKLDELERSQVEVKEAFNSPSLSDKLYAGGVLEGLPRFPVYDIEQTPEFLKQADTLSRYLRNSVTVQWLTNLLSGAIRAGCQRGQDGGSGWGRTEREWKKLLSSAKFENIVDKLSMFHQSALMESCRIRTEKDFDVREKNRLARAGPNSAKVLFKLRIVCQEGAVVRDGIEIDSCVSVGKMEMGEIVEAYDRCVNSSGVLRYRTKRGWVSELTRGHGREPIAEVIQVWKSDGDTDSIPIGNTNKRIECRIPDLCSVGASVLARLQNSYSELFSSLSRLVIQGVRSLPVRSLTVTQGSIGAHVVSSIRMMTSNIERGFNQEPIRSMVLAPSPGDSSEHQRFSISEEGAAMYLGCIFSHLHSCLFEERRERRMINVPIVLFLMQSDCMNYSLGGAEKKDREETVRFFSALSFVFKRGLADMAERSCIANTQVVEDAEESRSTSPVQAIGRSVASSLPPSIALLRRLMSGSNITSSPLTSILSRFKGKDLETVLGDASFSAVRSVEKKNTKIEDVAFHPERCVGSFHCKIAEEMLNVWTDKHLVYIPSHILHPLTAFAGEIISSLEENVKTIARSGGSSTSDRSQGNQYDVFSRTMRRQRLMAGQDEDVSRPQQARLLSEEHFEANEETLTRLIDMGFNRDHALFAMESTESNRLEVAMEYALAHPPPSAEAIERRRAAREARQRQAEENRAQNEGGDTNESQTENQGESNARAVNQDSLGSANNADEGGRTSESMDIDMKSSAEKSEKEREDKKQDEDDIDRRFAVRLESCLRSWVEQTSAVSLNLLSGAANTNVAELVPRRVDNGKGEGDGEIEALTVVISSFLLDLCQRYPSDRSSIIEQLLKRLGSQLHEVQDGATAEWRVIDGHENSAAALCHAAVLFMRALPKSRIAVLEHGLVSRLVSCVQSFIGGNLKKSADAAGGNFSGWPMWLAPALLLLDVMAQPMAAFTDNEQLNEAEEKSELQQVRDEHKKQATALSDAAQLIFSTIGNKKSGEQTSAQKERSDKGIKSDGGKDKESNQISADSSEKKPIDTESKIAPDFSAVPPYFPLIPNDASEKCLLICLTMLGKSRKVDSSKSFPPPGIVQALLLLLSRVIRTPKMASRCLRMGAAELIVSLPKTCRFAGHTGIVTVILRRLLEDESTLQASMETEIRGTVSKLIRKQRRGFSQDDEKQSVPCRSFMQAVTPLICRDPLTFIKAAAMSLSLEPDRNNSSNGEARVILVSAERRASYVRAFADGLSKSVSAGSGNSPSKSEIPKSGSQKRGRLSNASAKSSKSKSPHRSSQHRRSLNSKKSKKEKNHSQSTSKKFSLNGTPVNHITSLLVSKMMALCHQTTCSDVIDFEKYGEDSSFMWIADVLNVLADLILAVPACATAIHKYRPLNTKERSSKVFSLAKLTHALTGCPQPPKTVVSFLLHHLLPQNRWVSKKDHNSRLKQNTDDSDDTLQLRKSSYIKSKVSQSSARLLVALVARAGEGRRRVVADLAFALSGGRLGFPTSSGSISPVDTVGSKEKECYALRAWGELSIGLAAPRSTGINHDNTSSLSFEMVKLMLDFGMAHALMYGIQRVDLQNPMAPSICSYLLYPLEVFTRDSVCDKVQGMVDKEAADKKKAGKPLDSEVTPKGTKTNDIAGTPRGSTSQRRESEAAFVEDAMLEDGFDAETAARNSRERIGYHDPELFDTEGSGVLGQLGEDIVEYEMETADSGTENDDDIDMEEDEEMEEDDDSSDESDEEITSDEESNESDGDSSDDSDGDDEEEESEEEDADGIDMSDIDDDDEDANNETFEDEEFFEGNDNEEEAEEPMGEGQELEEGWTRIESGGMGGMLMGSRQNPRPGAGGGGSARSRGFIDIAEAMIGTLLRTGEIQGDALAEIEDTLGIRIMSNRNAPDLGDADQVDGYWARPTPAGRGNVGDRQNRLARAGDGGVVGTLPQVSQRNPPDIGYSAYGGAGVREISSMEYVFGGPCVAGGSRNYDVVSPLGETESDTHPQPSQRDAQLFPGGPVASTHAGTRQSLHPLLGGVDLPPVNSLVSDLLPHGTRAISRGQTGHRRPGDWNASQNGGGGYLVSTSSGNIIRLNRGQISSQMGDAIPDRSSGGLAGWTDDGLPFDGTGREFSNAFGQAFEESLSLGQQQNDETDALADSSSSPVTGDTQQANMASEAPAADENEPAADGANENVNGGTNTSDSAEAAADPSQEQVGASEDGQPSTTRQSNAQDASEVSGTINEGDGMASSLARGLRLSPGSDSGQQDQVSTGNVLNNETISHEARPRSEEVAQSEAPESSQNENDHTQQGEDVQESNMEEEALDSEVIEGDADTRTNEAEAASADNDEGNEPNGNGLVCPPGMDLEVFNTLPLELQQEVVDQHRTASEVASQLDSASALDPEALAALPEDMRREVIAQEQQERRLRDQAPADPSNAEEMDNANFVASLSPELREEILLTADDAFLNSLPPNIIAEAQVLRERASAQSRRFHQEPPAAGAVVRGTGSVGNNRSTEGQQRAAQGNTGESGSSGAPTRRKQRIGKIRVECDRSQITYLPSDGQRQLSPLLSTSEVQMLIRLLYLLSPVRPERLLQKVFQNLCSNSLLRGVLTNAFIGLLNDDGSRALDTIATLRKEYGNESDWRNKVDEEFSAVSSNFPPPILIGTAPEVLYSESMNPNLALHMFRRRPGSVAADSMAANLPTSARGSSSGQFTPPVVVTRIIDVLAHLSKNSPKVCLGVLASEIGTEETGGMGVTCFDKLLDLLKKPQYSKSSSNLEQLLSLVESFTSPLSHLPRDVEDEIEVSQRDIDAATQAGKEWVDVPRIAVSQSRLQLLCSVLRMESCRDTAFVKVNTIARRLCRIEANRGCILGELATVAQALGADAIRDLRSLNIRLNDAIALHEVKSPFGAAEHEAGAEKDTGGLNFGRSPSSSVTLSTSTSEVKLLRVLQTLQLLCGETLVDETTGRKQDGNVVVTEELVELLQGMSLDDLWDQLSQCLKVVQVLEGVATLDEIEENGSEGEGQMDTDDVDSDENVSRGKKLQNSVAGLITRFLPTIEAFFVVNASATRDVSGERNASAGPNNEQQGNKEGDSAHGDLDSLVGGRRLVDFVVANKVLLNALIRNNPALLEKGLRAMVQVPRCRVFLDFDVKRQWFKTQVRRLRQHASRRHGSLRLSIRRKHVFEDAYHQLRIRNADEMRGRLHITFRNEEGVDAGGLSREFFGILAKEIFNPNYALFTSTEDGCTFQPNQHSSINPDHLSYFRFVGRIVGKAVADGFLLDAHFTRSLYKHMLGLKPTHHDMEAIDPDYYKNLKMIMEYKLADIGLDLTFSTEDHSFGRSQIIDLLPEGRKIPVTEETKAEYVSLVCQHRMTTAIQSQIKAYLDGFYELVSADLISIFTPKELELLISGLPDIDVHDLKKNTDYQGYKATDKEIGWFWNILFSLSRSEKAAFLQFVTGSSKVPLAGFSELQGMRGIQKFSIHKAGGAPGALMSAHTCFNSLDLPVYKSEDEMREKLLYAISEGATGFLFA